LGGFFVLEAGVDVADEVCVGGLVLDTERGRSGMRKERDEDEEGTG
jgi:hypothetical protein